MDCGGKTRRIRRQLSRVSLGSGPVDVGNRRDDEADSARFLSGARAGARSCAGNARQRRADTMRSSHTSRAGRDERGGFTLIELLMAVFAASVLLTSLYGVFSQALKRRDE